MFRIIVICIVLTILFPKLSSGEEATEDPNSCNGEILRPKKDQIPIYQEPALDSKVIARMNVGARLCSIGEQNNFGIINWEKGTGVIIDEESKKEKTLAFVRLVDVFRGKSAPILPADEEAARKKAEHYYRIAESGVLPEDPLLPYRPLIRIYEELKAEFSKTKRKNCEEDNGGKCE